MRFLDSPHLRVIGVVLLLAGTVAYLGLRSLFLDHWIAVVMFGATGWMTGAVYAALCMALTGGALFVSTFLRRRRPVS
jgi:hypothetical protein